MQRVLTASTAETDNPDIRDRAYVYWRLLSSDPAVTRQVVLADRPPITSTIQSLPQPLLEELITEISTLASVYQKPASTFIGQGRFASDAVQKAAIEEQLQNARENPIAAATAAAAGSTNQQQQQQSNAENLLDIDFDGAAPASMQKQPQPGGNGLEGLAGTPQRGVSPAGGPPAAMQPPVQPTSASATGQQQPSQASSNANDLADIFGNGGAVQPQGQQQDGLNNDLMNGFAGMDMGNTGGKHQQTDSGGQTQGQGSGKSKDDLLDLF